MYVSNTDLYISMIQAALVSALNKEVYHRIIPLIVPLNIN